MDLFNLWFGLVGPSIALPLVIVVVTTQITLVAITVYLHRFSAHRSLTMNVGLQHFFRFWVWLTTGMSTTGWTAIHRKHHALTETTEDPHSPVVQGLGTILWQGTEAYRDSETAETLKRYGKGCPDDWLENNVYATRDKLGVSLLLIVELVCFGAVGVVMWAIQMLWTPFFAAGVINGIGHAIGYRNFEVKDASTNIVPWGIFICGEELHNNHHTYPNSPKLSVKKWEFDLGWLWIRVFEFFGLVKPNRVGPVIAKDESKSVIDLDTMRALINDRFVVMSNYASDVVHPSVKSLRSDNSDDELHKLLRRAKKVICRDESQLGVKDKAIRDRVFEHFPLLEELFLQKKELLAIWEKRTGNSHELMEAFRRWCASAEATATEWGVEPLRAFVRELKTYSVPKFATA